MTQATTTALDLDPAPTPETPAQSQAALRQRRARRVRARTLFAALLLSFATVLGVLSSGTAAQAAVTGPQPQGGTQAAHDRINAWLAAPRDVQNAVRFWGNQHYPQNFGGSWYPGFQWAQNGDRQYFDRYTGGRYQDRDHQLRAWLTGNGVEARQGTGKNGAPVWTNIAWNQWPGTFTEYDVVAYFHTPATNRNRAADPVRNAGYRDRGNWRLVRDDVHGHTWYTDDHYRNFHYIGVWWFGPNGAVGP